MNLNKACINILNQLAALVKEMSQHDFIKPSAALSHSTIGQHLRHTLEFFICFEQGGESGIINYDKRAHDKLIENDKIVALSTIERIIEFVNSLKEDKPLKLEVGYDVDKEEFISIDTTTSRELVYNIEHAVHHMAIMKIGVREISPGITLPKEFGIAVSTVRYKEALTASNN